MLYYLHKIKGGANIASLFVFIQRSETNLLLFLNMYYSFNDKKILGWKYYQHSVEQSHSLGLRLLPSMLTAVLVIILVARVLAVIDNSLEMKAIRGSRSGVLQESRGLVLIPTAKAAAPYDVKLDYSKEAVKLIQSAYDIEAGASE